MCIRDSHTAVKGEVNDVFYYYREQAALKARQFQRALDDIVKAIEMNPTDPVSYTHLDVYKRQVINWCVVKRWQPKAMSVQPSSFRRNRLHC